MAADGLPRWAISADGGQPVKLEAAVLASPDFVQVCGPQRLVVSAGADRYVSTGKSLHLLALPAWRAQNLSADTTRSWYAATCSAAGDRIAATVTPNGGDEKGLIDSATRTIWLLTPDGKPRLLVGTPSSHVSDEAPRLSRDGRLLLYLEHPARYGTNGRLYLLDLQTGKRRGPLAEINAGAGYYGLHDWPSASPWYQPGQRQ